jgi:hypothetical protein
LLFAAVTVPLLSFNFCFASVFACAVASASPCASAVTEAAAADEATRCDGTEEAATATCAGVLLLSAVGTPSSLFDL